MHAPEINPTITARDELRSLVAALSFNCTNGDLRVGSHQIVTADPYWDAKSAMLHVDLTCRPLGSALINPGGTKVSLQWHAGIASSMPVARELDNEGHVEFEVRLPRELVLSASCQLRAPESRVKLVQPTQDEVSGELTVPAFARRIHPAHMLGQLPTLVAAGVARFNDSAVVLRGWNPVEGLPNTLSCTSDDGRVTAFATYRGANVVLHFQAAGDCAGKSVWWATGTAEGLVEQGTEELGPEEDHLCSTKDVEIPLPSNRQVYFELTDSR